MNKLTRLIPAVLLLGVLLAPFAYATFITVAEYGFGNGSNPCAMTAVDPSATTARSAVSETFYVDTGCNLSSVQLAFSNKSFPSGHVKVRLEYPTVSSYAGHPNGTVLEESTNDLEMGDLVSPDQATFTAFNFTFANTTQLLAGGYYCLIVFVDHASVISGSSYVNVRNANGGTYPGDLNLYYSSGWTSTTGDMLFYVYGEASGAEPTATPTPTAPPTSDSDETNELINTFTDYLIPLILFLLPAFILGWLTHWEKWPILIGLGIGSGLTYLFMGVDYLWLVILVVIGIGAAAYQSTRGWS